MRELAPHKQVVPAASIDPHKLAAMLAEHMYKLEQIIKKMQRDIPIYVDEYLFSQNATQLTVQPQSQNLECITALFATCGAATGATLTLGGSLGQTRTITLPQGNSYFYFGPHGMLLNNGDIRQITQATANTLGLELLGFEVPDKGVW